MRVLQKGGGHRVMGISGSCQLSVMGEVLSLIQAKGLRHPLCCDKEDLVGEHGLGRKCKVRPVIAGGEGELKERCVSMHRNPVLNTPFLSASHHVLSATTWGVLLGGLSLFCMLDQCSVITKGG